MINLKIIPAYMYLNKPIVSLNRVNILIVKFCKVMRYEI